MAEPIKNKRVNDLAEAPTPQNTPATNSQLAQRASQPSVSTINEEDDGDDDAGTGGAGLGLANNPALLSMIQGKLGTLVGKPSGYIDSLPQAVKDRISGLKGIQLEHAKLETQFQEELLELEKKYFKKYEPLYQRRSRIIAGTEEPSEEEVSTGKELADYDDNEEEGEKKDEQEEKGIPEFWLTALKNLVPVAETISDRDEEALSFLTDIRMHYLDKPGFALVFEFAPGNPFFSNKTLTKTYYYQEETGYGGDFIYDHAEGDNIEWTSSEKNLTVRIEKRKQRNKHTKATRTIEKTIPTESFFTFFSPPSPPSAGEDDEEVDEDEVPEDLEERLEVDYQLGEEIKEKLIPRAVDWYTGEALEYEDLNELDDEEGYDDEEGAYDEDDSDDDDDEKSAPNANGEKPSECNQQ